MSVRSMKGRAVAAILTAGALALSGCGSGAPDGAEVGEAVESAVAEATDAVTDGSLEEMQQDAEQMAEEMAEGLEAQQEAQGGGSATLTAGDQTWTFDRVLCAFGEEEIGQEGAEFVLSSIQDGLQFYVSIDEFGHFVSIDDVEDFENPSVALSNDGAAGEFITLDGKDVSGEVTMVDDTGADDVEASFEATCP
ncbi:hypothetical protein GA707_10100 [Nostocoides sp. F2B08]|uniref:hypothetical protein n=1 Tax=Nostocoides sp. F2B08 TaxID=2653936 RepID=UPI001263A83F|nr:hypothetical protein [Tetrasphaera sp. F2B08]KAB7743839.1 hypothetical protein GA707_10100 [Tetrasphaera sp. F2B08]